MLTSMIAAASPVAAEALDGNRCKLLIIAFDKGQFLEILFSPPSIYLLCGHLRFHFVICLPLLSPGINVENGKSQTPEEDF